MIDTGKPENYGVRWKLTAETWADLSMLSETQERLLLDISKRELVQLI